MMMLGPITRHRSRNHAHYVTTLRFVQSYNIILPQTNSLTQQQRQPSHSPQSMLFQSHYRAVSLSSSSSSSSSLSLSASQHGKEVSTSSNQPSLSIRKDGTSPTQSQQQQQQQPPFQLNLSTVTLQELEELMIHLNVPKYRGQQIYHYIRNQGITDLQQMILLPKKLRQQLQELCTETSLKLVQEHVSTVDGTVKRVYELHDTTLIESVLMGPYNDGRYTACISSQVGCAQACVFCATGQMGFTRQLSASEIFEQVATFHALLLSTTTTTSSSSSSSSSAAAAAASVKDDNDSTTLAERHRKSKRLSNVVFMGMGEVRLVYCNFVCFYVCLWYRQRTTLTSLIPLFLTCKLNVATGKL